MIYHADMDELARLEMHLRRVLEPIEGLTAPLAIGILSAAGALAIRQHIGMEVIPQGWTKEPGAYLALRAFERGDDQVSHLLTQVSNRYLLRYLSTLEERGRA